MERPTVQDNLLLEALPAAVRARLAPQLEPVALAAGQVLADPGHPLAVAYFPCTATLAVRRTIASPAVATADVGREGLVGLGFFWSGAETETLSVTVRLSGSVLCLAAERFAAVVRREPALRTLLGRYSRARLVQLEVSAVCNAVHPLPVRLARWLLVLADHSGRDAYALTHEQLARMLGVRRASVSEAIEALQRAGFLQSRRGQVRILDRAELESSACTCYAQLRRVFGAVIAAPLPAEDGQGAIETRATSARLAATAGALSARTAQLRRDLAATWEAGTEVRAMVRARRDDFGTSMRERATPGVRVKRAAGGQPCAECAEQRPHRVTPGQHRNPVFVLVVAHGVADWGIAVRVVAANQQHRQRGLGEDGAQHGGASRLQVAAPHENHRVIVPLRRKALDRRADRTVDEIHLMRNLLRPALHGEVHLAEHLVGPVGPLVLRLVDVIGRCDAPQFARAPRLSGRNHQDVHPGPETCGERHHRAQQRRCLRSAVERQQQAREGRHAARAVSRRFRSHEQ